MFSKALIFALLAVAHCQLAIPRSYYGVGSAVAGIPVYRSSANYGGLYSANGYGYGANLGRVAGLGALRTTGAIGLGGALGYGTGAYVAGAPVIGGSRFLSTGLTTGSLLGSGVVAPVGGAVIAAQPAVLPTTVVGGLGGLATTGLVGGINAGYYGAGLTTGFGSQLANLNIARGISASQAGPVNAAVTTLSRTVDYRPVPYTGEAAVIQDIDVPPVEQPLRLNFQSKSSPLQVSQQHIPAEPGQTQVTQSEDEPQTAIHNVLRPVIQQVNEVVQPYRTLTQTVEPVIEQTHTNIAQGEGVQLTGLQSGIIGGTGQLAASGVAVAPAVAGVSTVAAAPALAVASPAVASPGVAGGLVGLSGYRAAYGYGAAPAYYGGAYRTAVAAPALAVGGYRTAAVAAPALYGGAYRTAVAAPAGVVGLGYGTGLYGSAGYLSGLTGLSGYSGLYGGLSGLRTVGDYGTTSSIVRY